MKLTPRKILNILFIAALAVGVVFYGKSLSEKEIGTRENEEAKEIVSANKTEVSEEKEEFISGSKKPTVYDPYVEELITLDIDALREVNPEAVGWIFIPDTNIDYPVLQHEDNQYYLKYTWEHTRNNIGAIFLDCETSADLSDFNTLVYGHRINNKTMFGSLYKYLDEEYLKAHPSIYLVTDDGVFRYDIFAACQTGLETIPFAMKIETERKRSEFIDFAIEYADAKTGFVPSTNDSFLTLATCSFNETYRDVVQAVLNEEASVWFD